MSKRQGEGSRKRDMGLCREILMLVDDTPGYHSLQEHRPTNLDKVGNILTERYADDFILRHIWYLFDAGLLYLNILGSEVGRKMTSYEVLNVLLLPALNKDNGDDNAFSGLEGEISWEGYEYLDAVRDDAIWNKVKGIISQASFTTIKHAANTLICQGMDSKLAGG